MFIELEKEDRDELITLVEARIRELGPEIRRSRTSRYHDGLQRQQHRLERLLHRLHETEYDVTA